MKATDLYFPRQAFMRTANAAVKPSTDVEDTISKLGAHPLGLPRMYLPSLKVVHLRNILHNLLVGMQMPRGKDILLQYPMQYGIEKLANKAKKRGNRLIIYIHDVNELRSKEDYNFPAVLSQADVIIGHTPNMAKWLKERYPQADVRTLNVFDYIQPEVIENEPKKGVRTVAFAGNLAKSKFLQFLNLDADKLRMTLFGVGCPKEVTERDFVDYQGSCMPDELPEKISREHFGLVWDGTTPKTCDGDFGQYLRYNAPYKLSSYIAAGIPVIVWSGMGIAPFVLEKNIGIAVDSLEDLETVIGSISDADYSKMRQNVRELAKSVTTGGQALSALRFY